MSYLRVINTPVNPFGISLFSKHSFHTRDQSWENEWMAAQGVKKTAFRLQSKAAQSGWITAEGDKKHSFQIKVQSWEIEWMAAEAVKKTAFRSQFKAAKMSESLQTRWKTQLSDQGPKLGNWVNVCRGVKNTAFRSRSKAMNVSEWQPNGYKNDSFMSPKLWQLSRTIVRQI